jgi:transcriptional regulator with XRE-family HTH domain
MSYIILFCFSPVKQLFVLTKVFEWDIIASMEIGKVVKKLRKEKGLTQTELAQKIGKSMRLITYFERGVANVSLDTLYDIAKALDVPVSEIFLRSENKLQDPNITLLMSQVEELSSKDQAVILDIIATYLAHKKKK